MQMFAVILTVFYKQICKKSLFLLLLTNAARAQVIISGTIYDSSRLYVVPGVVVKSTGGTNAVTDSLGAYRITARETDSISFFYGNKPTQKFPVTTIPNYTAFDISLQIHVIEKYKLLK